MRVISYCSLHIAFENAYSPELVWQVWQEHNSAHPELQVPKGDGPQEACIPSRLWQGGRPHVIPHCRAYYGSLGPAISAYELAHNHCSVIAHIICHMQEKRKALLDRFYTSFDAQVCLLS